MNNVHQSASVIAEIKQYIEAGNEVTVHDEPISLPGFTGAGYVVTDPKTGAGSYLIEGGGHGALILLLLIAALLLFVVADGVLLSVGGFVALLLASADASASDSVPTASGKYAKGQNCQNDCMAGELGQCPAGVVLLCAPTCAVAAGVSGPGAIGCAIGCAVSVSYACYQLANVYCPGYCSKP